MSYAGKKLRLEKNCIFIKLDERDDSGNVTKGPISVVFRHSPPQLRNHYTPQNDSARMILDLLTHNQPHGVVFEDVRAHLLEHFQVDEDQATKDLDDFLGDLDAEDLLEVVGHGRSVKDDKLRPPKDPSSRGLIKGGTTEICCGFVINWYRP